MNGSILPAMAVARQEEETLSVVSKIDSVVSHSQPFRQYYSQSGTNFYWKPRLYCAAALFFLFLFCFFKPLTIFKIIPFQRGQAIN